MTATKKLQTRESRSRIYGFLKKLSRPKARNVEQAERSLTFPPPEAVRMVLVSPVTTDSLPLFGLRHLAGKALVFFSGKSEIETLPRILPQ
ncbi:hypothetical protein H6P81_007761 [Aristolochia fimbriata]|uniref:Uncharacterized protein n=1 Tax=Aristolochia fimbriata TaxID=158543 RepID=A0AAV7F4H1_ARIFI|nr:hypothetical protein H6P81_007761 [Aristolochia fimbriata]